MTLLCFGDSNTYGYDPRGFFGGRYDRAWPELLGKLTGHRIKNDGQCGRRIPAGEWCSPEGVDLCLVMLGTNDLLNGDAPRSIGEKMEHFLCRPHQNKLILIAPPPLCRGEWVSDDDLIRRSEALAGEYRAVAGGLGIRFLDAGEWGIPLCYDGVHFTEAGHQLFAKRLAAAVFGSAENPCCNSENSDI